MILANSDKLTINIKGYPTASSESSQTTLLYFSGDTFPHRDVLKHLGFIFDSLDTEDKIWHLLFPVSNLSDKIQLIRDAFPGLTILKH